MTEPEARQINRSTLADEAEPVRFWLRRFFRRRIRDHAEVEDMVQDVFTRIVAREGPETVEHLHGYVLKTASSVLADRARRRSSSRADFHIAFDSEIHADQAFDPARVLGAKEELQAATAALLGLPERTRTVFVLRRLEGQKCGDIAKRLGISVSAVEKHMVRAVHHLSIEMEKRRGS